MYFEKSCTGYGFPSLCRRASAGGTCTGQQTGRSGILSVQPDKIGDFVLLAGEDIAFGEEEGESIHTETPEPMDLCMSREIPLIGINIQPKGERFQYHKDVARYLMGMS